MASHLDILGLLVSFSLAHYECDRVGVLSRMMRSLYNQLLTAKGSTKKKKKKGTSRKQVFFGGNHFILLGTKQPSTL